MAKAKTVEPKTKNTRKSNIKVPRWFKIFIANNPRPGARTVMLDAIIDGEKYDNNKHLPRVVDLDA